MKELHVLFVEEKEAGAAALCGVSCADINTIEDYERIGGKTCLD